MKLLLHACCGPCSLEPTRILAEKGHDISIAYINSNIFPASEYSLRLETLKGWARDASLPVIESDYAPHVWEEATYKIEHDPSQQRIDRCRACYRLRLEALAKIAQEQGFEGISTTLSVSPYQYTDVIKDELQKAGDAFQLVSVFEDFRPYYQEATRLSKVLGMYRQNYCGCHYSIQEAHIEREQRKAQRKQEKERQRAQRLESICHDEELRDKSLMAKKAYQEKQTRKKAALKEYKARMKLHDQTIMKDTNENQ